MSTRGHVSCLWHLHAPGIRRKERGRYRFGLFGGAGGGPGGFCLSGVSSGSAMRNGLGMSIFGIAGGCGRLTGGSAIAILSLLSVLSSTPLSLSVKDLSLGQNACVLVRRGNCTS